MLHVCVTYNLFFFVCINELDWIWNWFVKNGLKFNTDKYKTIFYPEKKFWNTTAGIEHWGYPVPFIQSVKDLCVVLNRDLTWPDHVSHDQTFGCSLSDLSLCRTSLMALSYSFRLMLSLFVG